MMKFFWIARECHWCGKAETYGVRRHRGFLLWCGKGCGYRVALRWSELSDDERRQAAR